MSTSTTRRTRTPRILSTLRTLSGRSDADLVNALRNQVAVAQEGAELVASMVDEAIAMDEARTRMEVVEHAGDTCRADLLELLGSVLSPPVDREDLNRASRSIDDVLDTLRDFVRESDLYRVSDLRRCQGLAALVLDGIAALDVAVTAVGPAAPHLRDATLGARKAAGAIWRAYQYEMADLLTGGTPERDVAEAMKARELYRRLGDVGLRLGEAADALADGAMKRGR